MQRLQDNVQVVQNQFNCTDTGISPEWFQSLGMKQTRLNIHISVDGATLQDLLPSLLLQCYCCCGCL
jgi:hypothetical protein